jgi:signal transduction protein with GAF and PtsI domain
MLLGMGYDAVSVAPNLLNEIKYAVRRTPATEATEIARAALAETSSEGVRRVLQQVRERLHARQVDHNLQEAALQENGLEGEDPSKNRE